MLARISTFALMITGALAAACGGRSNLTAGLAAEGGSGGAPSSSSSTGGNAPIACAALAVTEPADVDTVGGLAARPALVFGTNNGRVVSAYHAWSTDPDASSELHVTTIEPWESWPPVSGDHFSVDPLGGQTFAVGDLLHGNVALLLRHAEPQGDDGLAFANALSATSPQTLLPLEVAPIDEDPAAVALVRGHDSPPVAANVGYVAMLAMWDTIDAASGAHALKLAIDTGDDPLFGLTWRPDDVDLACAGDRIAAAAVRSGSSWLVLAASSTDLIKCSDAVSPPPATSLALDRVDWGSPDTVDWSLNRADQTLGKVPVERIRMIPLLEGALGLVQRGGGADLVRVEASGKMHAAGKLAPVDGSRILLSEIVALSDGILLAHVDEGAPGRVHLELRDDDDAVRASAVIEAGGPIESLSSLQAKAGDTALLGWATIDGRLQLARVGCEGGS